MNRALTPSLQKWLSVLGDFSDKDPSSLARLLHQVDPSHFSTAWISRIPPLSDVDNVRIKSLNYKKILNAVTEFYSDKLMLSLSDFPLPDPSRVADGNLQDTGRLLQLVLGCAVNCETKHQYIEVIMGMEESVQQVIMQAIQELMDLPTTSTSASASTTSNASIGGGPSELKKLEEELLQTKLEKEKLLQKNHELENKVTLLSEEKSNLHLEFENFKSQSADGLIVMSNEDNSTGIRFKELKKQVESLQEDLVAMESSKDEYQVKVEILEKQLEESNLREAELQKLADQARKLKDEVDILREYSEKVVKYEAAIETYKKKMEEMSDLKRQVRILEEKNTQYMQQNMDLEEDIKKTGSWKPQVDVYKKQIAELHSKLESEIKKSDKLEFETKKLMEKLEALSIERDRLQAERDELKESNNDLSDEIKLSTNNGRTGTGLSDADGVDHEPESAILENIPPNVKERILKLQRENRKLKSNSSSNSNILLQTMIDDLKEREAGLQATNRKANHRIIELESKLEELTAAAKGGSAPRVPGSREELELKLSEANKKINGLTATISKKELEMQGMEERYKKYIEKAKSVIKTLDPKQTGLMAASGGSSTSSTAATEVNALKIQLQDKDRLIQDLELDNEKARAVKDMEGRLMSSAFYNLSMQIHRNAVESRLNNLPGQQSFLARQRQVHVPPAAAAAAKKNYNSSDFAEY